MADYPLTHKHKAKFEQQFLYQNPDGSAVNLTGFTALFIVKTNYKTETVIVQVNPTITALQGKIDISIPWSSYNNALPGNYVYELYLVDGSSEKIPFLDGKYVITESLL